MSRKDKIPFHREELNVSEIEIASMEGMDKFNLGAHRDDHYMFVIQQQGMFVLELDFNIVTLNGASLSFVTPGQVHKYIDQKNSKGWFVFVDPKLVSIQYRGIFDAFLHYRQVVAVQKENSVFVMTDALGELLNSKNMPMQKSVWQSLIQTIVGMVASHVLQAQEEQSGVSGSKYTLVTKFKQLVKEKFRVNKQVKDYASMIHITPLYLNEMTKKITGFSASYWIHQEIILEAKRLLYYTDLTIMEIAYEVGYEDHAYFSRFFKKNTGITASAFRS